MAVVVVSENLSDEVGAPPQTEEQEDHKALSGLLVVVGDEGSVVPEATRRVLEMAARNRMRDRRVR